MRFKSNLLTCIVLILAVGACGGEGSRTSQPSEQPQGEPSSPTTTTGAWRVVLKISVPDGGADGGMASNRLVAGGGQTATDRFDNAADVRALLAGPVQAYFVHTGEDGYTVGSEELWQDFRSLDLPAEWEIAVMADSGRLVTVSWTLPTGEVSCATHQFTLWDADGQLGTTHLCAAESVTYTGDGQLRHFVLRVS